MGLSMIPKCITTIRMLAFGIVLNAMDEYVCMEKSTTMKNLKHFCQMIKEFWNPCTLDNPLGGILKKAWNKI
jgi:hypothetical protein